MKAEERGEEKKKKWKRKKMYLPFMGTRTRRQPVRKRDGRPHASLLCLEMERINFGKSNPSRVEIFYEPAWAPGAGLVILKEESNKSALLSTIAHFFATSLLTFLAGLVISSSFKSFRSFVISC